MQPDSAPIHGATRLLVIVGDPIAQVRSPVAFNRRLAALGRDCVMVPWHAPQAAFPTVLAGLMQTKNLDGVVVTYPFKERALAFTQHVAPRAALVRAANALRREADGSWTADMFDGVGLIRAVVSLGQTVVGRTVKLLGAGGAGSAIAVALADAGVTSLSIHDRERSKAEALAETIGRHAPSCRVTADGPEFAGASLLINATPVGLGADDAPPVPVGALTAATTVIDIVTREGGTRLLEHARGAGSPHVGGAAMVEGQCEALLGFFGLAESSDIERAA